MPVGMRVQSAVAEISHIIALSVDGMAFSWGDYCYQPITANLGTVTERTLLSKGDQSAEHCMYDRDRSLSLTGNHF